LLARLWLARLLLKRLLLELLLARLWLERLLWKLLLLELLLDRLLWKRLWLDGSLDRMNRNGSWMDGAWHVGRRAVTVVGVLEPVCTATDPASATAVSRLGRDGAGDGHGD
jgi:hypothetical protein